MHCLPLASAAWKFRDATTRSPWRAAIVPGCVHRDLLRHDLIPDPFWSTNELQLQWIDEHAWEYRASFTVSAALLAEEVVDLVADGLDTIATVTLNGTRVAAIENMFIGHRWNVNSLLHPGRNELLVRFDSAMEYICTHRLEHTPRDINDSIGGCTRIRKQQCQFGWDWGPRLITAGIWRDIRLEGWSGNRLESVRMTQQHAQPIPLPAAPALPSRGEPTSSPFERGGAKRRGVFPHDNTRAASVTLTFTPELARPDPAATIRGTVSLNGRIVAQIENRESKIENPHLWWPHGQGAQPLYTVDLEVLDGAGRVVGTWSRRIGLRTIALDQHKDEWGESFQFVVNGRPVFAKGANWIPAHTFVAGLKRDDYARDLRAAQKAHMNMIRVWGGGVYESEDFYDLCDELGLLVWQDFMFACTLYPADDAFIASSREEAAYQIRRLRHRASLALWCGNNEVFGCNAQELVKDAPKYAEYEKLFHAALPAVVAERDGVTTYWPSSPWRGDVDAGHAAGEARGDTHYWDVWHARHPVKDYEKYHFRFASEFGMQSFSSLATQASFASDEDNNVFGPTMTNHQKNRLGNQIILDYISRNYRFPKDQDSLLFLSQLNQADCMQIGVEHYRRNMPRCMGALYWQLNDCWPVASWSSIEFTGRWKALHHVARRFFAPALVSAHVPGEELTITNNYRRTSVREVHLYTIYDAPMPARGKLVWDLFHLDGRRVLHGSKPVDLRPGESVRQQTLDLAAPLAKHDRDELYLRIALDIAGRRASEETVFLVPPRFVHLHRGRATVAVKMKNARQATLTFSSRVFQHRFAFDLPGLPYSCSDNFFELYPGEKKVVELELSRVTTAARLKKLLVTRSLVDTY